ncbi:hypothetical protein [Mycoplasma sp. 005V]|uniref:hypothetical protein n=1 Tax=unclassified Mycoplasma TaxID=2683645 RepID=UPI003A8423E7
MKKIKTIFSSLLGVATLSIPVLSAVACGNTETETQSADAKPFISLLNKLTFTYNGNKADVLAKDVTVQNIQVTGYNKDEFQVTIISVEPEHYLLDTVSVKFTIKDLKNDATSNEIRQSISGFKKPEASK